MKTYKIRSPKRIPHFWWDYHWIGNDLNHVVVESDHKKFPVIKYIYFENDSDKAIKEAEKLIADLVAGRKNIFYEPLIDIAS